MEHMKAELGREFCHRCDYCQPCTSEIPISTVMTSPSFAKRLPEERFYSDMIAKAMEAAAKCVDCGKCEERCPYKLPVREVLKERVKWFAEKKKEYLSRKGI